MLLQYSNYVCICITWLHVYVHTYVCAYTRVYYICICSVHCMCVSTDAANLLRIHK